MEEHAELLSKLIAIPSVNPMGRSIAGPEFLETALTDFLESWLRPLNLEVRRQPVSPGRDNLLATYNATESRHHVLLEVHQDTVPADGMIIEPFRPTIEGNRLYGRGACDNKGPMTAMLLALARLASEQPPNAASVTLALTVDEEHTFSGASRLVRDSLCVDCAVVAEPSELDIIVAHKGVVRWQITTGGRACHSSDPRQGVNAIYAMAKVIDTLERFAIELHKRPGDAMLGGPTISVGRIEGGVAVNVVPDLCMIEVDRRLVASETPTGAHREIEHLLKSVLEENLCVTCREPWLRSPALPGNRNGQLAACFAQSVERLRGTHRKKAVPFGTDAAVFQNAGIPSIVFGPGSVAQAHTVDEWIDLDEVACAAQIYFDFCKHYSERLAGN